MWNLYPVFVFVPKVPKTSKKRGPRGPYKKKSNNSFFTLFLTQLNYYFYIKTTLLLYQLLNS